MGFPLGPLLANMFMCSIEEKLEEKNELPSFYKHYVDDTLTIVPDLNEADIFLDKLNSCHRNLKFTMEIAEQSTIPFVGMNITKSGNRLETSVYRKSTNTGLLLHYHSHLVGEAFLSQMADQAGAYPGFRSTKRLGVFLLPPDGMLVHRRSLPSNFLGFPQQFAGTHLYSWVERGTVRVKCLAQEHNTMSPARARTRTARSRDERTNHEATAPRTSHVDKHYKDCLLTTMIHRAYLLLLLRFLMSATSSTLHFLTSTTQLI